MSGWEPMLLDKVRTPYGTGVITRFYDAEPTCGVTCLVAYDDPTLVNGAKEWGGYPSQLQPLAATSDADR